MFRHVTDLEKDLLREAFMKALHLPKRSKNISGFTSSADPTSNYIAIYRDILGKIPAEARVLTPYKIDKVLWSTKEFAEHKRYSVRTGLFISALMSHSYSFNKCQSFTLNTRDLPLIDYLEASGDEKMPIEVIVTDSVGNNCFRQIKHARIIVEGSTGSYCGAYCENSKINVKGDVGEFCGYSAEDSIFAIGGFAGNNCGDASKNCRFVTKKFEVDWNLDLSHPRHGCDNSEFVTASRRSYAKLKRMMEEFLPEMPSKNIDERFKANIKLTHDDGRVIEEKEIQS